MTLNFNDIYYVHNYGTRTDDGHKHFLWGSFNMGTNYDFISSLLKYNTFDIDHTYNNVIDNDSYFNFIINNTVNENNEYYSFDDFNDAYKTIIGGDILSHVNAYCNTSNLALGNMLNIADGSSGWAYSNNLVAAKSDFHFRATKDGDAYRYTSNNSAEALNDIDGGGAHFSDLATGYQAYYNYKIAQLNGETTLPAYTPAVNLVSLGIHAGLGKDVLQNLIDQIVQETKAIKAATLTNDDLVKVIKDLDAKQSGLETIDSSIYGYNSTSESMSVYNSPTEDREMVNPDDQNAIIYKLAKSLIDNGDIISGTATDEEKMECSQHLCCIVAGIIEKYWVENFNNSDAEPIDVYFAREFSAKINPTADSNSNFIYRSGGNDFKLNFSELPDQFTIIDRILEKQSFAELYTKMEDRSRLEVALFEATLSMDIIQNINQKEFEYRMNMLAALEKLSDANPALDLDLSGVNKTLVTQGPGQGKNPWWSDYFPWFKGFYGNLPDGATPDDMFDKDGKLVMRYSAPGRPLVDPYIVKINGVDYVMGKDDNKDGEINNAQEILGITDTVDTVFASLKALDANKDNYVSQEELQAQNIILKAMNESQRLNGSGISTDTIKGIDLSTLIEGDGTNNIYGFFNVQLKNGSTAAAVQTFENQNYFNNLFGAYADMSFMKESSESNTSKIETKVEIDKQGTENKNADAVDRKTFVKGFNFFNYLQNSEDKIDDSVDDSIETSIETKEEVVKQKTTTTKTPVLDTQESEDTITVNLKEMTLSALVEDICWKSNVYNLTSKQRYDIIDSVDISMSADLIIKKIQEKISKINQGFSA